MLDALLLLVHPACVVCADDKTMYVMAGLQTLAFLSNLALRPVHPDLHEPETTPHIVHNKGMHDVDDSFIGEGDRGWVIDVHAEHEPHQK